MDFKKRVQGAMDRYSQKLLEEPAPASKNDKPEKEVEAKVLVWLKQNGFCMDVIESKARYSTTTGKYTGRAASIGMPDLMGNWKNGLSVYVELKAPGRRVGSAIRHEQRKYLTKKIMSNCFAIVTDSAEYLEITWNHYRSLPPEQRQDYLLKELPTHNERQLKFD